MSKHFEKVKNLVLELGHEITLENTEDHLLVLSDENKGLLNLLVDCEDDLLILEQHIINLNPQKTDSYKKLLQMNRSLIHGAFVLDEQGQRVLFRDTLELPNLDRNEFEASVNALSMALAEYSSTLIEMGAKS